VNNLDQRGVVRPIDGDAAAAHRGQRRSLCARGLQSVGLAVKHFPGRTRNWTCWSYRTFWRAKDRGRRLDHMWASPGLAARSAAHRFVEETRRWDQPSDHVPLVTEFAL